MVLYRWVSKYVGPIIAGGYHTKMMNTTENFFPLQTVLQFPCIQLPLVITLYTKASVGCVLGAQTYRRVAQYESFVWGTAGGPCVVPGLRFLLIIVRPIVRMAPRRQNNGI